MFVVRISFGDVVRSKSVKHTGLLWKQIVWLLQKLWVEADVYAHVLLTVCQWIRHWTANNFIRLFEDCSFTLKDLCLLCLMMTQDSALELDQALTKNKQISQVYVCENGQLKFQRGIHFQNFLQYQDSDIHWSLADTVFLWLHLHIMCCIFATVHMHRPYWRDNTVTLQHAPICLTSKSLYLEKTLMPLAC